MSEVTKDQMQMRADDIAEVCEIMSIEDVKTKNARQDKYIEDTLNDVFSRHMPDLQPGEELGMGFGKERILNEVIREADANGTFDVVFDCENKELEDVYLPPSNPRPFVEPRKEIWMDDELGKADPEVQKRLMEIMEIMLTRKIKPKGETMSKQAEELWASDFHGKEYIKSMKASDRAELLELMVTRKWGETK